MAPKISINTQIYAVRLNELSNKMGNLADAVESYKKQDLEQTNLEAYCEYVTTVDRLVQGIAQYTTLCKTDLEHFQKILNTFKEADR